MQNMWKQERRRRETKTNDLYRICDVKKIDILCMPLPETQSVSVLSQSGNCYIGIDLSQLKTAKTERVHLAHEIGHCETGAFYNPYSAFDIRKKHENRADKWAIEHLIPRREWDAAIASGITEVWDLAEYFDVTEDFINKTIALYTKA